MWPEANVLLALAFGAAWLLAPLLVLHYRAVVIPRRYHEILDAFAPEDPSERDPRYPIVHYVRLMQPFRVTVDPWVFVRHQFMRYHGWSHYIAPLALYGVITAIGLHFCYRWVVGAIALWPLDPSLPPSEVVMALTGAHVWSIYEILNRRGSGDLTPDDLYDIAVRQLAAVPIGLGFSMLVTDAIDGFAAFAISAFPLRDVRQIMRQQVLLRASGNAESARAYAAQGHISQVIDGISIETAARLEELHIANALDLAYADPVRLMVRTGFSIRHVLSWIDQAMLAVYFGPHLATLRRLGIPCALDLCEVYRRHCLDQCGAERECLQDAALQRLGTALDIPSELLPERMRAVHDDPHVQFLRACWYTEIELSAAAAVAGVATAAAEPPDVGLQNMTATR